MDPTATVFKLNTDDLQGLRAQILGRFKDFHPHVDRAKNKTTIDNAPTLFTLAYGIARNPPTNFRVNTMKIAQGDDFGKTQALIVAQLGSRGSLHYSLAVFLEGRPADSTEQALRAILEKMEAMIGRLWRDAMVKGLLNRDQMLLKSIDE